MAVDRHLLRWNVQCSAVAARTGQQCGRYAVEGTTVCSKHGGSAPQVKRRGQMRAEVIKDQMLGLAPEAILAISEVLNDPMARAADRLKAADMVLDRVLPRKIENEIISGAALDLDAEIEEALAETARSAFAVVDGGADSEDG